MLKVAFLVCVNFALIQARKRGGCCIPSKWEGYEGVTLGYLNDGKGGSVQGYIKVAYDAEVQKIAADSFFYINGKQEKSKVIMDYQRKVQYVVYRGHCNITRLRGEFPKGCIPAGAKKFEDTHLGAGDTSLEISSYEIVVQKIKDYVTVTKKGCIPVGEVLQGSYRGVGFTENIGYLGIELGIKNPSVFNPPRICTRRLPYTEVVRNYDQKTPVLQHYTGAVPHHIERFMSKSALLGF